MLAEPVEISVPNSIIISTSRLPSSLQAASADVALDLQRLAHIGPDHPQEVLVHPAFAGQCHQWIDSPSSKTWRPSGPIKAADVDDVNRAGEQALLAAKKVRLTTVGSCR